MRKRDVMSIFLQWIPEIKYYFFGSIKFNYFLMYTFIILLTCQENWVKQFNILFYKWENREIKLSKNRMVEV